MVSSERREAQGAWAELVTNALDAASLRRAISGSRFAGVDHMHIVDHGPGMGFEVLVWQAKTAAGMSRRELAGLARADRADVMSMRGAGLDVHVDAEMSERLVEGLRGCRPAAKRWEPLPDYVSRVRPGISADCAVFKLWRGVSHATATMAEGSSQVLERLRARLERLVDALFMVRVLLLNLRADSKWYSVLQRVRLASLAFASLPHRPPGEVVVGSRRVPRGPDGARETLCPRGELFALA